MKFFDEAIITVQSGDGGRGCLSFRREKHVPRGGPDGGDGGKGGDVILKSTSRRRTLYPFQLKRQFKAKNGAHGQGKQKTGKNGPDLIIEIPPGTLVKNADSNEVLKDFTKKEKPQELAFSAEKPAWRAHLHHKDPKRSKDMGSREKLYKKLVQRYAGRMGYKYSTHSDYSATDFMLVKK